MSNTSPTSAQLPVDPSPKIVKKSFILRLLRWLITNANFVLSILTFFVLVIAVFQWRETQETRELEFRAYVAAKTALFVARQDNPAYGDVLLLTVNTGRTPAKNATLRRVLEMRDSPPPDSLIFNPSERLGSQLIYVPSLDLQTKVGSLPTGIADQLINQAGKPTSSSNVRASASPSSPNATGSTPSLVPPKSIEFGKGAYLYGIIDYKDIFDASHKTQFCFYLAAGAQDFINCPNFNYSD